MILNVLERLVLLNLLPKEGDFTTLKLVRVAREGLSFNDIENQKLKFTQGEGPEGKGQVSWNMEAGKEIERDIPLGEVMTIKIVEALKKFNTEGKLTDEHFTLYEKFVEPPPVTQPVVLDKSVEVVKSVEAIKPEIVK